MTPICTDSMGALHSRHKPRGLKALSTTRQAPQCHDRQEGGEGLLQAEKAIRSLLHLGVRAEAEQGKWLWKRQPTKWPPLRRKQGKVQKNKPVLISIQKLQVENEGKPLFSLRIIAAPATPKFWTDLFSWGKV